MALSLYVDTMRIALSVNPSDGNSWSHMYGSLCCLRESLTCYACRKLLINPVHSVSAKCQHNVCKRCVGSKMQMKCPCKWCSNLKEYEENIQLRIVLQCYKKMCKFTMTSGIFRCWRGNKLSSPMLRFVSMVYEGAGLEDNFHYLKSIHKYANVPVKKRPSTTALSKYELGNNQSGNGQRSLYSMKLNDTKSPKVVIKKASIKDCILESYSDSDASSDVSGFEGSNLIQQCLRSVKKSKSCRCGMATRNPGKLTCCGQRCPCYVNGRACINCRCRGCRNPQKNLISSPPLHKFRSSPEPNNMDVDHGSFDETSCSDSDRDPSV